MHRFLIVLVLAIVVLAAPGTALTLHQGIGWSTWSGGDIGTLGFQSLSHRTGYHVGISHTLYVQNVPLRLSLTHAAAGVRNEPGGDNSYRFTRNYGHNVDFIEVDALGRIGSTVYALLGPYGGIRRSCHRLDPEAGACDSFEPHTTDWGLRYGAGVRYPIPGRKSLYVSLELMVSRGVKTPPFLFYENVDIFTRSTRLLIGIGS